MSDASTVRPHLARWFENRRIVFWHDPDGQYAADLDGLDLPGVQTIRVANDEYGIKNRLLRDEPTGKFLRSVRDFARKEWPLRGSSSDGKR